MYTPKGAQKIAESGPDAFHRIAVDFAEAIAIIVSRLFRLGVTDGRMPAPGVRDVVVGVAFIGVEQRGREGILFDLGLDRRLLRIVTDGQMDTCGAVLPCGPWCARPPRGGAWSTGKG